jgi:hypothetical protein
VGSVQRSAIEGYGLTVKGYGLRVTGFE